MEYRQFLAAVKKAPYQWELQSKAIRTKRRSLNIIAAVYASRSGETLESWENELNEEFGRELGLQKRTVRKIIKAGENKKGHNPKTRRDLLRATGLFKA